MNCGLHAYGSQAREYSSELKIKSAIGTQVQFLEEGGSPVLMNIKHVSKLNKKSHVENSELETSDK